MQIRLEITEAEIRALQETYAEKSPKPRLSFEEWAGREIASHFSKACSQKQEWACRIRCGQCLRKRFSSDFGKCLRSHIDHLNEAATTAD